MNTLPYFNKKCFYNYLKILPFGWPLKTINGGSFSPLAEQHKRTETFLFSEVFLLICTVNDPFCVIVVGVIYSKYTQVSSKLKILLRLSIPKRLLI